MSYILLKRHDRGEVREDHRTCRGEGRMCGKGAPHVRGSVPHVRHSGQPNLCFFFPFLAECVSHFGYFPLTLNCIFLPLLSRKPPQTPKYFDSCKS
ncbi:hypothetical protein HYC85_022161 [Camellia sinensis]|uniref:Uncharacterized protein n=1 Tax=Camellia sinensis TaxID=4442 RepID=A0A7J7GNI6_CAMSI|nr:hypothetical protein HYC85_022161 [Camellia sinensis]